MYNSRLHRQLYRDKYGQRHKLLRESPAESRVVKASGKVAWLLSRMIVLPVYVTARVLAAVWYMGETDAEIDHVSKSIQAPSKRHRQYGAETGEEPYGHGPGSTVRKNWSRLHPVAGKGIDAGRTRTPMASGNRSWRVIPDRGRDAGRLVDRRDRSSVREWVQPDIESPDNTPDPEPGEQYPEGDPDVGTRGIGTV